MGSLRLAAILLIVAGVLGLVYGGFTFTKATHQADVGPLHLKFDEKQRVNVPIWAGVAAIAAGAVLLGTSRRRG